MNKLMYKKCEEIPKLNLNMWMSCCDESCQRVESVDEKANRKRRSHHLYSPIKKSIRIYTKMDCESEAKKNDEEWISKNEKCTKCKCDVSSILKVKKIFKYKSSATFSH